MREHFGTRLVVASFGVLCGLTGIIAGIYEILQGNVKPSGLVISTIGSNYQTSGDFTYYAVTIIPNLRVTGTLAILFSSLVIIWATKYVQNKNGALVLLALSVAQMLVGGGWVIDLAVISSILASRIGKPVHGLKKYLPVNARVFLVQVFPVACFGYGLISACMLVLTITGVNKVSHLELLEPLAAAMFVPIILMILGGLTGDIKE